MDWGGLAGRAHAVVAESRMNTLHAINKMFTYRRSHDCGSHSILGRR